VKSSTKWLIAIVGFILFIGLGMTLLFIAFITSLTRGEDFEEYTESGHGEKIAVIELKNVIVSSDDIVRQFKKYRDDKSIRAILFHVDSPGGGVVASHEIYEEVKRTRAEGKPVVVSMGALAASGGYYVSCGATRIVANPGTLTGSIGVISEFVRIDSLLHKIGIDAITIKSGRLKDAGSPYRSMTTDDREYFQNLMDDVHRQFIAIVEKERGISHDTVVAFADGRVFTGEQALRRHLVDTLGTYEDAIRITARLAGIREQPQLIRERKRVFSLLDRVFGESVISGVSGLVNEILHQPLLQYKMMHGF
jgi:protease-4